MEDAEQTPRRFRLHEANGTLDRLTRLLTELRPAMAEARRLQREMRFIQAVGHDKSGRLVMAADYRACRQRFDELTKTIAEAVERIEELGCMVENAQLGIVDFPADWNGRPVLFCWRLGEPEISHYHAWNEGFPARRPLKSFGLDRRRRRQPWAPGDRR